MASVERRENESLDSLLSRFQQKVQESKILTEYMRHQHFIPKSKRRKLKSFIARQKMLKKQKKEMDGEQNE